MKLNLGYNIRKYRKENGFTQESLAEYLGVSYQAVSRWENGTTYPDMELVPVMARLFGVSSDALFDVSDSLRESAAKETVTELARLSREEKPDTDRITELIRDVRHNYLGCDCFWEFWLSVNSDVYRLPEVLPEVRLTVDAILAGNFKTYDKHLSVQYFSAIENETLVGKFLDDYSTELDISRNFLLYDRCKKLGDTEKADIYRQKQLFSHIAQLVCTNGLWSMNPAADPDGEMAQVKLALELLHGICECSPDEKHPVSGYGQVDVFVYERLDLGMTLAAHLARNGENEKALAVIEDVTALLEKVMAIKKTELGIPSPWLGDIKFSAEEMTDGERYILIHDEDGFTYCVYPSRIYTMLSAAEGDGRLIRNGKYLNSIRDDARYTACVERVANTAGQSVQL